MRDLRIAPAFIAVGLVLTAGLGAWLTDGRTLIRVAHANAGGCSLQNVIGTYGVSGSGTVGVGSASPVQDTEVGLLTADGNGNVFGSVTFSANGTILEANYTGTYTVDSDCTARASISDSLGEKLHETGVILRGGSEIRFIGTDAGAEVSRVAVRLGE